MEERGQTNVYAARLSVFKNRELSPFLQALAGLDNVIRIFRQRKSHAILADRNVVPEVTS